MARAYRFNAGDKVIIKARKSSSVDVKKHDGEHVTIKSRCPYTWAYVLEEYPTYTIGTGEDAITTPWVWSDGCFIKEV